MFKKIYMCSCVHIILCSALTFIALHRCLLIKIRTVCKVMAALHKWRIKDLELQVQEFQSGN